MGALAAGACQIVAGDIDSTRKQGFRIVKSRIIVTMTGKTTAEGPVTFGVALNLSGSTAITTALNNDPQDKNADTERGKGTYLKVLGTFGLVPTVLPSSDSGVGMVYEISYGKNGWSIPEAQGLLYWARNQDSSALTTGMLIQFTAEHFGVWLND